MPKDEDFITGFTKCYRKFHHPGTTHAFSSLFDVDIKRECFGMISPSILDLQFCHLQNRIFRNKEIF